MFVFSHFRWLAGHVVFCGHFSCVSSEVALSLQSLTCMEQTGNVSNDFSILKVTRNYPIANLRLWNATSIETCKFAINTWRVSTTFFVRSVLTFVVIAVNESVRTETIFEDFIAALVTDVHSNSHLEIKCSQTYQDFPLSVPQSYSWSHFHDLNMHRPLLHRNSFGEQEWKVQ